MKKFLFLIIIVVGSVMGLKNMTSSGKLDLLLREHPSPTWTPRAVYWLSQISYMSNKPRASVRYMKWLTDEYPQHPDIANVHWQLGQTYEQLNRRDMAIEQYGILKDSFSATSVGQTAMNRYMNMGGK